MSINSTSSSQKTTEIQFSRSFPLDIMRKIFSYQSTSITTAQTILYEIGQHHQKLYDQDPQELKGFASEKKIADSQKNSKKIYYKNVYENFCKKEPNDTQELDSFGRLSSEAKLKIKAARYLNDFARLPEKVKSITKEVINEKSVNPSSKIGLQHYKWVEVADIYKLLLEDKEFRDGCQNYSLSNFINHDREKKILQGDVLPEKEKEALNIIYDDFSLISKKHNVYSDFERKKSEFHGLFKGPGKYFLEKAGNTSLEQLTYIESYPEVVPKWSKTVQLYLQLRKQTKFLPYLDHGYDNEEKIEPLITELRQIVHEDMTIDDDVQAEILDKIFDRLNSLEEKMNIISDYLFIEAMGANGKEFLASKGADNDITSRLQYIENNPNAIKEWLSRQTLTHFHVHSPLVTRIPDGFNTSIIEFLHLNGTKVKHLPKNLYAPELIILNLSQTPIESLPNNLFCPKLKTLDLAYCKKLFNLPDNLSLPQLENLTLSNSSITHLPEKINLPKLQYLFLESSNLAYLPDPLNLPELIWLNLSETPIRVLPKKINLPKLQKFMFTFSKIVDLPKELDLPSLQSLDLSDAQNLTHFPDKFNPKRLTSLKIPRTKITSFPKNFRPTNLRFLDITGSSIEYVPEHLRTNNLSRWLLLKSYVQQLKNEVKDGLTSFDIGDVLGI